MTSFHQQPNNKSPRQIDQNEFLSPFTEERKDKSNSKNTHKSKIDFRRVEDNPQYYRVDNQICHKLFKLYKKQGLGGQMRSFEERQQSNNSLNYHKIMKMTKDLGLELQVDQKLALLRAIKKFSFNQNLINQAQFSKIYKVMVHGINVKEASVRQFISKYPSIQQQSNKQVNSKKLYHIRLNKNVGIKNSIRSQTANRNNKAHSRMSKNHTLEALIQTQENYSRKATRNGTQQNQHQVSRMDSVGDRRRMLTQGSSKRTQHDYINKQLGRGEGYMQRAMQKNKISKLTWQGLANMRQNNLPSNIIVPSFVNQLHPITDQYAF